MSEAENIISIPNENRAKKIDSSVETILSKSIKTGDRSYIQNFILSSNRSEDMKSLDSNDKERLALLLTEFLDQPLRVSALECMYELLQDVGTVDGISKKLAQRSSDFNKLIILKGKIDYLKYINKTSSYSEPENEFS